MVSKIPPSGSFNALGRVIWVRHYRTHRRGWTMEEAWEDSERKVWNYCSEPVDGHGAQWEERWKGAFEVQFRHGYGG